MKKILCFFLSMFLLLNIANMDIIRINSSAEDNTSEYATVKVITNNTSEKIVEGAETGADIKTKKEKKTTLIKKDNKIYMSLDDICEFTRTNKEKTDNKYILRQGWQEITVLIEDNGNSKLKSFYGDFNIQTVTENNKVYCEPEPLMSMLFAECTYYDNTLLIDLPQYTVYEATNFDYSKYQSDVLLYGTGENDNMAMELIKRGLVEQRLWVSILSDVIVDCNYGIFATIFTGHNTTKQYYYEAFNEVLGYDIYSDKSVIEKETKIYEKINDLGSFLEKTQGGDISDTPFTDFYISSYIGSYAKKGLKDNNSLSVFNDTIRDLSTNGRVNEKLNSYLNQSGKDVLTNILFNSALEYVKRSSYDRKVLEMFKTLYSEDTVNKYNISLSENGQFFFQCARDYYNSCGSFDEIIKEVTLNESINKFSEMIIKGLFSVATAGKSQEVFETYETILTAEKLQEANSLFKPVEKINNSAKYFVLAKMQSATVLTLVKIHERANESLNSEDMKNLVSNFDFYNRVSAVMIKTLADSYQLPTTTKREKDLIANSDDHISDLCRNIYKLECCEYNLPTKEELNNKNYDVFNNFFSKQQTEPTSNYTAVDLIDKTIPEIISLMNGEYQIIKTENDLYIYIQNQSVLSGMEFYVKVSGDNIVSANNGEEIHNDTLRAKLEAGELTLDGIQVNNSGKVSETIQANMDYKSCSKVLGDFNCIGGTGGYLGGDVSSISYAYNDKNAKVILKFNIPEKIYKDLSLGKISSVSSEQMEFYNPKLKNVVIRKAETNTGNNNTSENENWRQLYADELKRYMASDEYNSDAMFDLYDINNDNIPELFISSGTMWSQTGSIYTVFNEKLVDIGILHRFNKYSPSQKVLYSYDLTSGNLIFNYRQLENDLLINLIGGYSNSAMNYYVLNDKEISSEEYNKEVSKYEADDYIEVGRKYKLDEATINSVLLNIEIPKEPLFTGIVNTEKDPLNVRKSPSTEAEIIGRLDKGSTVTVYSEADGWCEIEYNGGIGYVSKEYIKINGDTENQQTISISDNEILKAVNKYLEENQSNLGIWLSDGNPYCPSGYMASNDTNWSCPINTDWDNYSSNEIAGAYPHFAYVDKSTLKCTLTANYETVIEFDLSDYIQ